MTSKQKFYIYLYLICALVAIMSLAVNIRIIALNDRAQKYNKLIEELEEKNTLLQLEVSRAQSFDTIDAQAMQLGMTRVYRYVCLKP